MGYNVIRLKDVYLTIGEKETKELIKDFECPLNKDVEYFLKQKAIEFSKQDIAETFLVTMPYKEKNVIVGYFAIANKTTEVSRNMFKGRSKKRFLKFATYRQEYERYCISLPLIGQLGKNFHNEYNKLISGNILLKLACDKIREVQEIMGGRIIYLECEDKIKLKEFYESNRLRLLWKKKFGKRWKR